METDGLKGSRAVRTMRRAGGDEGTSMVEFALVLIPLCVFLFGIIAYGYAMAFKQNMVQAATEGARAGAVAATDPLGAAENAVDEALDSFGQSCGSSGMTCTITTISCTGVSATCVKVDLEYDYENFPLLPDFPIISAALPDTLPASATAETNT